MKFRDGYWEIREGVKPLNPADIVDADKQENALTVYASTGKLVHPGERIAGVPLITTEFSSPLPDIIHVKMYHHKGGARRFPEFTVLPDGAEKVRVDEEEDSWVFRSGELCVKVSKTSWNTVFSRREKILTGILGRNSGHFTVAGNGTYMAQYLSLTVDENVYGLGERFTNFVKNGQAVDIWNEDGGACSEQAYKNIPFYITNRGYGVFVNNSGRVSFEVASEVVNAVQFSVPGEMIDYYIIAGDTPLDVLRNYTALTGRPARPPAWSFGLWLSTSFTTDYDEKTVNQFIDGMAERNIPLHVFHFDCFWMKGNQWVDFEWDKAQFPDPEGMLSRLKKKGLRICVWINPYVAQKSPLFDEAAKRGYLLKKTNGDVWQWDRWQPGMGIVDFTNSEACAWYRSKLERLLDMGVDTFKTDFGERIPLDVVYSGGADPEKMHNYYTYLYNKTVFTLLEEKRGKGEALVFARSATAGSQQFPLHWGGDCSATYESMAETLRGGLSLGLAGFGFWSHDISGFESTATPDLFKRWAAFGLLSSHSRLHGNQSYRVPWNFDEEAGDVLRFFVNLKCRLMPYLYREAVRASEEGVPLLRAMFLQYPEDPACTYLDRQYFLGESLLAAPVFSEDGKVSYYLPHGNWTSLISGGVISGGGWKSEQHSYFSLPLMVKPGTVLPLGDNTQSPEYDYSAETVFHVFEIDKDGGNASARICGINGKTETETTVKRQGNSFSISRSGSAQKPWRICLRGIHGYRKITGASAKDDALGLMLNAEAGTEIIVLEI
ncbi:MAG: alpha-xylosidase [Treponema sp.]|jgi:alpha-D-xyloside xylohydrolase|nr:alpha-xylosidase [Treponema sp.]